MRFRLFCEHKEKISLKLHYSKKKILPEKILEIFTRVKKFQRVKLFQKFIIKCIFNYNVCYNHNTM